MEALAVKTTELNFLTARNRKHEFILDKSKSVMLMNLVVCSDTCFADIFGRPGRCAFCSERVVVLVLERPASAVRRDADDDLLAGHASISPMAGCPVLK